jgi:hypothetical protein
MTTEQVIVFKLDEQEDCCPSITRMEFNLYTYLGDVPFFFKVKSPTRCERMNQFSTNYMKILMMNTELTNLLIEENVDLNQVPLLLTNIKALNLGLVLAKFGENAFSRKNILAPEKMTEDDIKSLRTLKHILRNTPTDDKNKLWIEEPNWMLFGDNLRRKMIQKEGDTDDHFSVFTSRTLMNVNQMIVENQSATMQKIV